MSVNYKAVESKRTFYIIFDKRKESSKRFWNYFTSKGFDHVYVLTGINGITLAIKPTPSDMILDEWPISVKNSLFYLQKDVTAVLKYEAKFILFKPYIPRGTMTCVVIVKYLLGLKGVFVFTPLQLYKRLLKEGAVLYGKQNQACNI